MATPISTAILIVHGAYFLPGAYEPFCNRLRAAGLTVRCPRLPSCGDSQPPTALLQDDLAAVRTAASELISTNHKILVLAHSYGGIVASAAITPDLYSSSTNGPGVSALLYLAAWLLLPGQCLDDIIAKHGMQSEVDLGTLGDGMMFPKNAPESFYNDIERDEAEELAKANVTHNWMAAVDKMSHAPWRDLPTTYVFCEEDKALLPGLQRAMVDGAVEAGGAGIETVTIQTGHCPFLSRPEVVQELVEGALVR